jgi:microcystin-dependent protein
VANIKISQLPNLSQLANTTQFPVANANVTYAVTSSNVQSYMATYPGGTFTGAIFSATGNVIAAGNLRGGNLSVTGTATVPTPVSNSANTQVATTAFVASALSTRLPTGVITMWYGTIANIPAGWLLCDGTNGTPDLRNRFILGAVADSGLIAVSNITGVNTQTGGSKDAIAVSHTHTATNTVTDPGHAHSYNTKSSTAVQSGSSTPCWFGDTGATTGVATTNISVTTTVASAGSSGTNANLPPYYALAYIMKS